MRTVSDFVWAILAAINAGLAVKGAMTGQEMAASVGAGCTVLFVCLILVRPVEPPK